jgi:WD40 repeat protein
MVESPAVQHTGGLGRFGGGPEAAVANRDGRIFAMNDGSVWNVATGGVTGELGKPLRVFYMSTRGGWLAFTNGNSVKIWTLASGEIRDFAELDEPVEHLAGSPDETMLVAVTRHGGPELFQVASGTHIRNLTWSSDRQHILSQDAVVAFSPDAKLLACGSEVWTVDSGVSLLKLEGNFEAFTSDGRTLLTMVGNHTVEEWDLSTRQRSSVFDLPTNSSDRFAFRPDGKLGVLSQPLNPNQLTVWDIHAGLQTGVVRLPSITGGYRVNFLGDSDWLIAGNQHSHPQLVRISTGEVIAILDSDGKKNWSVVRTSDGAYDASAEALIIAPQERGRMFVDGTRIDQGQFKRVPSLLGSLPGAPTASSTKPRATRR